MIHTVPAVPAAVGRFRVEQCAEIPAHAPRGATQSGAGDTGTHEPLHVALVLLPGLPGRAAGASRRQVTPDNVVIHMNHRLVKIDLLPEHRESLTDTHAGREHEAHQVWKVPTNGLLVSLQLGKELDPFIQAQCR
ncbi:hypothetical protein [Saccharopolyspora pogona]|uniref:hypothetical protein n=1 Tax=Saccharopolyspora pogona TaxID=333966 RepID=UPI00168274B4|nr:hypothetical protein [Saccharopolyspora pogona]